MTTKKIKNKMLPTEGVIIGALLLSIAWVIPAAITSSGLSSVIPAVFAQDDPPPPPALATSIRANPASGTSPLTVTFEATASGGTPPYTYSWDFGDGSGTSNQAPPVRHTYQ
ncbi:MAG TPA: PKD domain-containing protein, partial [Nitrososphaera sp.]